jgi:hypothetical protein
MRNDERRGMKTHGYGYGGNTGFGAWSVSSRKEFTSAGVIIMTARRRAVIERHLTDSKS